MKYKDFMDVDDTYSEASCVFSSSLGYKTQNSQNAIRDKFLLNQLPPPRELRMKEDQDWTSVYPTAAPFKWSAVPLPIRMGYPVKRGVPPHKYGNAELLKVLAAQVTLICKQQGFG